MYKAIFSQSNISEYYNNDELLFIVKRKPFFFIREKCDVYNHNTLILSYYSYDFTFLHWKLKNINAKSGKTDFP
jgi:hypothetical protein